MCPWAHQTSLWIRNVRSENGITINWKFFSLEETNRLDGKKHPWERAVSFGWTSRMTCINSTAWKTVAQHHGRQRTGLA